MPHLVEMHKQFSKEGLVIYSVVVDDPRNAEIRAVGKEYLDKVKVPFPVVYLDMPAAEREKKLRLEQTPGVFVFNRDNKYVLKMPEVNAKGETEEVDYDRIDKTVKSLLKK